MCPVGVGHYENFPVASLLCPPALRAPIRAIYAFARTADDLADEGDLPSSQRLRELARYRQALTATCSAVAEGAGRPLPAEWPAVFDAIAGALRQHPLSPTLLHALIDAFEQDVRNPPYPDRDALLAYCRRSANPVGRLLLQLYGIDEPQALCQSDAICSALQLINFWQDLSVDLPRGRSYLPLTDLQRHGLALAELQNLQGSAGARPVVRNSVCDLVRDLVRWAASLMVEGAPLPLRIPGRAGWELRLVVHGGWRIVEKIARMNFRSIEARPRLHAGDAPLLAWRALSYAPGWFDVDRLQ
jgi:squalene synthase HpnC